MFYISWKGCMFILVLEEKQNHSKVKEKEKEKRNSQQLKKSRELKQIYLVNMFVFREMPEVLLQCSCDPEMNHKGCSLGLCHQARWTTWSKATWLLAEWDQTYPLSLLLDSYLKSLFWSSATAFSPFLLLPCRQKSDGGIREDAELSHRTLSSQVSQKTNWLLQRKMMLIY